MKYDSFQIQSPGVTVVCGGEPFDRDRFASFFLESNSGFTMSINPAFELGKKKLFERRRSIYDIMHKEAGKQYRDTFPLMIQQNLPATGRAYLIDRSPRALSGGQKLFFSLFFEALMGTKGFILRDDGPPGYRALSAEFIIWLKKYTSSASVLWLTDATPEELSQPISSGNDTLQSIESLADAVYVLKDWEISKRS